MKLNKLFLIIINLSILLTNCTDNYKSGLTQYKSKKYEKALTYLRQVENSNENYNNAKIKIAEIDSILSQKLIEQNKRDSIAKIEQKKLDSIAIVKKEKQELDDFKSQIKREIESIKIFDGNKYRDNVSSIQIEVALFDTWAKTSIKAENHKNKEINKLGKTLKWKVVNLQKVEFPKLRKNYGKFLKQKLWEQNIEVKIKGKDYKTLEFVGAIFANNKNKKDTQETLSEILHLLRFKRINYKWYKYDREYTYYTLNTKRDSHLNDLILY